MVIIIGIARARKEPVAVDTGVPPIPPAPEATGSANLVAGASAAQTFTGKAISTPWGNTVASIVVKDGKVINATMPQVPNSPPSTYAEPYLIDQAIRTGNANIQGVSGATYTSIAFKSSLESALAKANTQGQTVTGGTATPGVTVSKAKPTVPRKYRREEEEGGWDD